jgi:hypothetical protein
MRTTLTLDDDVSAKLKTEMKRTDKTFKQAVNDLLRIGLNTQRGASPQARFVVNARDLGDTLPGVSLDNVGELLDRLEQPPTI